MPTPLPDMFVCPMPDAIAALPVAEHPARVQTPAGNFMLLDRTRGFIRCRMPLAAENETLKFSYTCWIEAPFDVFEQTRALWIEPTTRAMIRFQATLANAIPPFEDEMGRTVNVAVRDWRAPQPVIIEVASPGLGPLLKPPGPDLETYHAIQGELRRDAFAREVEQKLAALWGPANAYEEFESRDWQRAPRKQMIAEFSPSLKGEPWRYATLGLSSRPMPDGDRGEFAWEMPRRVTDTAMFHAMAKIAAQPWRLRQAYFDGHVLPIPGGFPPGSQFKYALCYDASRAYTALKDLVVFDQRVVILMPLPILERERANLRRDETKFLDLKEFLR